MQQLPAIREAVEQIASGRLTPLELVEHCLGRIRQFDDRVRAWVLVDEDGALREAKRLTELAKRRQLAGPLHGIPIGIKDVIDVAGWPTKAGSPIRENAPPAAEDAPVVALLRQAGAVILGKTVTTEWACFDPPPTRNPWNLSRTPGGSSSGSAAAVAAEMCMAALGTQTGGSIIRPAAYCGVCGLKPTFGVIDMEGIVPVSFNLDHVGPIARSASDLYAVYCVLVGFTAEAPLVAGRADDPSTLRERAKLRFAAQLFTEHASDEVREVYHSFQSDWHKLHSPGNRESTPLSLPSLGEVSENHWRIMAVEAAEYHRENFARFPEKYGPKVSTLIEAGLRTTISEYAAALRHRLHFRREMLKCLYKDPILVMPATTTAPPGLETTGDPKFNAPWSYAGFPAVTVPYALTRGLLPVGLQLVSYPGNERRLLEAAIDVERTELQPPLLAEQ